MHEDDALGSEMRRLPGPRPADPPPLDPDTVERMLVGAVDPADAPPGYAGVVEVLAAAAAPPSAAELDGETEAVAAFRAARRPVDPSRRKPVLGRLVSAKVLVGIAAGVVSVGTAAAAATGTLPGPAQEVAHRVFDRGDPSADAGPAGRAAQAASSSTSPEAAAGAAGLCRAWAAGRGGEHGKKLDAASFERLATAAGGADKVAGYCSALVGASSSAAASTRPSNTRAPAQAADAALAGLCRAWLAAERNDQTAKLGKAIRERLATAAGGTDKVTAYCTTLVSTPPASSEPTARSGGGASTQPPRPTPPTPTDHGAPPATPHD